MTLVPRIDRKALTQFLSSLPAAQFNAVVEAWKEYATTVQQEETKRAEIEAKERVALDSIRTARDTCMTYLGRSFDERKGTFELLFRTLSQALDQRDPASVTALARAIADVAKSSPLADLERTRRDLKEARRFDL